ncbi:MAG: DUF58 domain-containing protein [Streptomycetales bacterium]
MRAAFAGLTTRGRSFLVAGLVAVACSILLGQRDLLRVGVFLAVLPLASALVVSRTRYRVAGARRLDPARVTAGQEACVILRLDNISRLPTGLLLVEDRVPPALGEPARFVLDRVEPRGRREVTYRIRSEARGRFRLGPLTVRLTDPFGMCELDRSFAARDTLVVTPPVDRLPPVEFGGGWTRSGDSISRTVAAAGEDDVVTREYRHGDGLRRVHWRSTARYGKLMVRREEQPWQSNGTVLLDVRAGAHRGEGLHSSFEWALRAAGSVALHLAGRGYAVRLCTGAQEAVSGAARSLAAADDDFEGRLLGSLAETAPVSGPALRWATEALHRGPRDSLIVAILGELSPGDAEDLARLGHNATAAFAVVLDTGSWLAQPERVRAAARAGFESSLVTLHQSGWRVLPVASSDTVAGVWQYASRRDLAAVAPFGFRPSPTASSVGPFPVEPFPVEPFALGRSAASHPAPSHGPDLGTR